MTEAVESAEESVEANTANILSKKDIADATFEGTYRAITRFQEPADEVPIEKVHRLRCDDVEWKFIGRIIYREEHNKEIDEKDLPNYVDNLRKQHKRQYPDFYATEK